MITKLEVDNFKSLNNVKLFFKEITVLVGNNASGKTSVIQALDFLINACKSEFYSFFESRELAPSDIVSKLSRTGHRKVRFYSEWSISLQDTKFPLSWELEIEILKNDDIRLINEKITDLSNGKVLLYYDMTRRNNQLIVADSDGPEKLYPSMTISSSTLHLVVDTNGNDDTNNHSLLVALKKYLLNSYSYDLLSPNAMRHSSRGKVKTIGSSGKELSAYIAGMNLQSNRSLTEKLQRLLGDSIAEIKTRKVSPGWSKIEEVEKFGNKNIAIKSVNMSDGILRLIALLTICEYSKSSLMLMDELENGINVKYAEKLITILKDVCEANDQQMIFTTHSTVFLDYFSTENIVLIERDPVSGWSKAYSMSDLPHVKELNKYMYPGEIVLNLSNQEMADCFLANEINNND